ncbi:MAG: SpoIIE family protein phosphatase [Pseudomonadales bacterium]
MNTERRILVIDDDRVIRQSIAAYLEDSGFEVLLADDGATGLNVYRHEAPDLVVCDLRMPGLDGISVLHEIAKDGTDTPIIVISGAGVMADVVEALRIGASDYLIKPIIDLEVLEHAISRSLESSGLKKENARYRHKLEQANKELQSHLHALEQDQQAGRHVQMQMLPATPTNIDCYQFEHQIIPSLYLSGDFVEYFTVGRDNSVFMIADVSGHGASSAFVTVLLKNLAARARSNYGRLDDRTVLSPAKLLENINKELLETELGKHITMVVATLNSEENSLRYSIAGHLPCPILTTPDEVHYLEGKGLPVGLFADATYDEVKIDLPKHFRLTLFSDGILELLAQKSLQDKEAYLLEVARNPQLSLEEIMATLHLAELQEAPDDIAVLMVSKDA